MTSEEKKEMTQILLDDFKFLDKIVDGMLEDDKVQDKDMLLKTKENFAERIKNLGLLIDSYDNAKKR